MRCTYISTYHIYFRHFLSILMSQRRVQKATREFDARDERRYSDIGEFPFLVSHGANLRR